MLCVLGTERMVGSVTLSEAGTLRSALESRESLGAESQLMGRPQDRESGCGFPDWSNPRWGEYMGSQ